MAKQGINTPTVPGLLSIPGQVVHLGALGYSLVPPHLKTERLWIVGQGLAGGLIRTKKDRPTTPPIWKSPNGDKQPSKDPNRTQLTPPQGQPPRTHIPRDSNLVEKDSIYLVDFEVNKPGVQQEFGGRNYSYLKLDFVPESIEVSPEPQYATIASLGRNNPFYHYVGGEKTIEFDIDWFSLTDNSREDVITKCRWLEALSFADGYNGPPHRIKIIWTKHDYLFADSVWVIKSAPYKLKEFVQGYSTKGKDLGSYQSIGLMPQSAIQHITLARVTDHNLSHLEMMYSRKSEGVSTSGLDGLPKIGGYIPPNKVGILGDDNDFVLGDTNSTNFNLED